MKTFFTTLILFTIAKNSIAQQDEQLSQYMFNPLYFNPGYAGSRNSVSFVGICRFQWVNMPGAPKTQWLSAHSPILKGRLGIGGHFTNDRIGNRGRSSFFADVSTSIQVNNRSDKLAAGLSIGMDQSNYDFTTSTVTDLNDPYYGQQVQSIKPNLGAGLYYFGMKHYLGLSVPRLFQSKTTLQSNLHMKTVQHVYLAGGYIFDLNSMYKLKPSILLKYAPHAPLTIDLNVNMMFYEKFWTGIMYRFNEAIGVNFVYTAFRSLQIGYVYDLPINGLRTVQYGSHEILLQYDLNTKRSPQTSPRYF